MTVMTTVTLLGWAILTLIAVGVLLHFGRRGNYHDEENHNRLMLAQTEEGRDRHFSAGRSIDRKPIYTLFK